MRNNLQRNPSIQSNENKHQVPRVVPPLVASWGVNAEYIGYRALSQRGFGEQGLHGGIWSNTLQAQHLRARPFILAVASQCCNKSADPLSFC